MSLDVRLTLEELKTISDLPSNPAFVDDTDFHNYDEWRLVKFDNIGHCPYCNESVWFYNGPNTTFYRHGVNDGIFAIPLKPNGYVDSIYYKDTYYWLESIHPEIT